MSFLVKQKKEDEVFNSYEVKKNGEVVVQIFDKTIDKDQESLQIIRGYIWREEHTALWFFFNILKIIGIAGMMFPFKQGEKIAGFFRPFDYGVNYSLFYIITNVLLQALEVFDTNICSVLVIGVPLSLACFVTQIEAFTKKFSLCKPLSNS
jgi:hypothetical protein